MSLENTSIVQLDKIFTDAVRSICACGFVPVRQDLKNKQSGTITPWVFYSKESPDSGRPVLVSLTLNEKGERVVEGFCAKKERACIGLNEFVDRVRAPDVSVEKVLFGNPEKPKGGAQKRAQEIRAYL